VDITLITDAELQVLSRHFRGAINIFSRRDAKAELAKAKANFAKMLAESLRRGTAKGVPEHQARPEEKEPVQVKVIFTDGTEEFAEIKESQIKIIEASTQVKSVEIISFSQIQIPPPNELKELEIIQLSVRSKNITLC